jgi:hypothetical protein
VSVASAGTLTRTGYTATGYNTAANGTGTARAFGATFSMPASNVELFIQWELIPVTEHVVNVSAGAGGSVNPSGERTVVDGGSLSIQAIPALGQRFVQWSVTGGLTVTNVNSASTTITGVTASGSVTASFEALPVSDNNPFLTTTDLINFIDLNPEADLYVLTDDQIIELNVEDFKSLIRRRINLVEPKEYEWRVVISHTDFALSDIYVTADNAFAARTW